MAAPQKPAKKSKSNKVYKAYKVEGGALKRLRKTCPKCGSGVFLAEHKNRTTCGNCHYTEFMKRESK